MFFLLVIALPLLCETPLAEWFKEKGFVEICEQRLPSEVFDKLYLTFDTLIDFLQNNPAWAQKLCLAKDRFIRSKEKKYYSTDFFGFYDESKKGGRGQISFYYSPHFHNFVSAHFPEFNQVPEIVGFFSSCFEIQKPCANLFKKIAKNLGLDTLFSSDYGEPPILFKVVKYLPSYVATRPHYDGTAFSLFLDSTDNESLLLCPYKSSFAVDDFFSPFRKYPHSVLLIPGAFLTEFSIYPTPHIVMHSGKTRYAAIAFAMRPQYAPPKVVYTSLPTFSR
jgi:hypothetical protein